MKNRPIFKKLAALSVADVESLEKVKLHVSLTSEDEGEYLKYKDAIIRLRKRQLEQDKRTEELARIIEAVRLVGLPRVQGRYSSRTVIEIYPHGNMPKEDE